MPEHRFDVATAARRLDDRRASVSLDPQWNVDGRILNGGYLQAVTVRAAATVLGDARDPVAVSTSFAAPAEPGPAHVTVEVLRRGGRLTAASATLRQGDTAILAMLATFSTLPTGAPSGTSSPEPSPGSDGPAGTAPGTAAGTSPGMAPGTALGTAPGTAPGTAAGTSPGTSPRTAPGTAPGAAPAIPVVPPPDACLRIPAEQLPGAPGLTEVIDYAYVPDSSRWLMGDSSAGPAIRCWMSFADARELDPLALTALVDMAPPVSFAQGRFGWAPTLHLQVGVFARPRGTHVLVDLRGEPYDGAFVAEDGLLWDAQGTLVARSRQIAVPPRD